MSAMTNRKNLAGRRVVGSIWNVGVGDPSSHPVWNANSEISLTVD